MKKVIVTGFEPFADHEVNPTLCILELLGKQDFCTELTTVRLPVVFDQSFRVLEKQIETLKPDIVICLGLAANRQTIDLERVALNLNDARIPDNAGNQPVDETIELDGQTAYFTTLPVKLITQAINNKGIAASVSYECGTFVCNHVFYRLMHYLDKQGLSMQAGFIHVPNLLSDTDAVSMGMTLDDLLEGVKTAIVETVNNPHDKRIIGGNGKLKRRD